jgi:hypothetical protein
MNNYFEGHIPRLDVQGSTIMKDHNQSAAKLNLHSANAGLGLHAKFSAQIKTNLPKSTSSKPVNSFLTCERT